MRRRPMQTLKVMRREDSPTKDRHGNAIKAFADPAPVPVWVIAPRNRDEPREQGRSDAVSTVWDIYAPLGTRISAYDRVELPDGTMTEVVGDVGTWEKNPHSRIALNEGIQFTVQSYKG